MTHALLGSTVLVTPRSFGAGDPGLRRELAAAVREVRYNDRGRPLRAAELRAALVDIDGLLAGLDEIDASVIAAAPRLRVIARYGVGTSNVDLQAAACAGVVVTNTPGANAEAVAELTIGFLFALARSITSADRAGHAGIWHALPGSELLGKTVGILGLGKIGRAVARRAAGLGCSVLAYDPILDQTFNVRHQVRAASLEEVVREAHFLTLHLPLLPETRDLVDRRLLASMRSGSFLINTARGELVVEEDLLWALETGHLQGAALDTLRAEPPPADHPLLAREDVIVTPHIGANTAEARTTMGRMALHDLLAVLAGGPPRFPVTPFSEGHP
jgi:phosphoglycerate dehydrogenase-like enzyme